MFNSRTCIAYILECDTMQWYRKNYDLNFETNFFGEINIRHIFVKWQLWDSLNAMRLLQRCWKLCWKNHPAQNFVKGRFSQCCDWVHGDTGLSGLVRIRIRDNHGDFQCSGSFPLCSLLSIGELLWGVRKSRTASEACLTVQYLYVV